MYKYQALWRLWRVVCRDGVQFVEIDNMEKMHGGKIYLQPKTWICPTSDVRETANLAPEWTRFCDL